MQRKKQMERRLDAERKAQKRRGKIDARNNLGLLNELPFAGVDLDSGLLNQGAPMQGQWEELFGPAEVFGGPAANPMQVPPNPMDVFGPATYQQMYPMGTYPESRLRQGMVPVEGAPDDMTMGMIFGDVQVPDNPDLYNRQFANFDGRNQEFGQYNAAQPELERLFGPDVARMIQGYSFGDRAPTYGAFRDALRPFPVPPGYGQPSPPDSPFSIGSMPTPDYLQPQNMPGFGGMPPLDLNQGYSPMPTPPGSPMSVNSLDQMLNRLRGGSSQFTQQQMADWDML